MHHLADEKEGHKALQFLRDFLHFIEHCQVSPVLKGYLKRKFLLMQMNSTVERRRMSLKFFHYFVSSSSYPLICTIG